MQGHQPYGDPVPVVDFLLGLICPIGIFVELWRRQTREVAWWWFIGGSAISGLILTYVVPAIIVAARTP